MNITITINTDNDAFTGGAKAEVLRILAEAFRPGSGLLTAMDGRKLRDLNGNTVGQVQVTEDAAAAPDVSSDPDENWRNDAIQFPRLLAEVRAVGLTDEQYAGLAESMDLDRDEIDEVLERAEEEWEAIKDTTPAPDKDTTR